VLSVRHPAEKYQPQENPEVGAQPEEKFDPVDANEDNSRSGFLEPHCGHCISSLLVPTF